jgi:histidinol phosphatase-like PHP family hydrolase
MVMIPTIHMNGDKKETLLEGYCTAIHAVRAAAEAVQQNAHPNGRNFYPQGPDAIHRAIEEHIKRMVAIRGVLVELETMAEGIA